MLHGASCTLHQLMTAYRYDWVYSEYRLAWLRPSIARSLRLLLGGRSRRRARRRHGACAGAHGDASDAQYRIASARRISNSLDLMQVRKLGAFKILVFFCLFFVFRVRLNFSKLYCRSEMPTCRTAVPVIKRRVQKNTAISTSVLSLI